MSLANSCGRLSKLLLILLRIIRSMRNRETNNNQSFKLSTRWSKFVSENVKANEDFFATSSLVENLHLLATTSTCFAQESNSIQKKLVKFTANISVSSQFYMNSSFAEETNIKLIKPIVTGSKHQLSSDGKHSQLVEIETCCENLKIANSMNEDGRSLEKIIKLMKHTRA